MPTFSAITLDRFLEPGATKPVSGKQGNSNLEKKRDVLKSGEKFQGRQISPALYTTPETTPLPDSPFSFPPSPYIINHKRRGPNLQKSFSQSDVLERAVEEDVRVDENGRSSHEKVSHSLEDVSFMAKLPNICEEVDENGFNGGKVEISSLNDGLGETNDLSMSIGNDLERENVCDDFFDPQESLSVTSTTEGEDNVWGERSFKLNTPISEFFDACEELSSGSSHQYFLRDFDAELRDIRLNLLMEIERRKRAEDALNSMVRQWERLREQLSLVGVTLPAASTIAAEDEKLDCDPAEELCQQVSVARAVANAVGRGSAKAEVEMEMESWIEAKNFEIARLSDRLHYYETVNHEMSQRNQEAVEMSRHQREIRKRRQRWIWSSIGITIALGSAALAWSYLPTAKGSFSTDSSLCPEKGDAVEP
ncbi:hypothetical protein BVC80_1831g328 [Macleaya cordata]|uniref:Netrin receptor DCC n=1 Tax=Macleaya cordata TaxID=56857 RepID=A0A200R7R8_MACCD|nr:hypothetical protein BVC80_1831g328 [Macleaya cordata]